MREVLFFYGKVVEDEGIGTCPKYWLFVSLSVNGEEMNLQMDKENFMQM